MERQAPLYPLICWWTQVASVSWPLWMTLLWILGCVYLHNSCFGDLGMHTQEWNFWTAWEFCFYSGHTPLYSQQQCMRALFSPCPCQHLFDLYFLTLAVLMGLSLSLWFAFPWWWWWASFPVPTRHLHFLFGKMSIQFLCQFLIGFCLYSPCFFFFFLMCFFYVELYELFICVVC